ncbi:MAG: hypothetical protein HC821_05185 [Lewinella sp.]|nr:hypothetical protein [Lewinella sp.]
MSQKASLTAAVSLERDDAFLARLAAETGASYIELHTGCYAEASGKKKQTELKKLKKAAEIPLASPSNLPATHDIAQQLGHSKAPGQTLVGFALETNEGPANARRKLAAKKLGLYRPQYPGRGGGRLRNSDQPHRYSNSNYPERLSPERQDGRS